MPPVCNPRGVDMVEGCHRESESWVARKIESPHTLYVAGPRGVPTTCIITCGGPTWRHRHDRQVYELRQNAWEYKCVDCAVEVGWIW